MSLSVMTSEWSYIANDITLFVLRHREQDSPAFKSAASTSPIALFNLWNDERGIAVYYTELALWCVNYIQLCARMPLHRLRKAAHIDGLI